MFLHTQYSISRIENLSNDRYICWLLLGNPLLLGCLQFFFHSHLNFARCGFSSSIFSEILFISYRHISLIFITLRSLFIYVSMYITPFRLEYITLLLSTSVITSILRSNFESFQKPRNFSTFRFWHDLKFSRKIFHSSLVHKHFKWKFSILVFLSSVVNNIRV